MVFIFFLLWLATPQTPPTHTYRMVWTYDCVHWTVPKYFQFGVYSNGIFTPIGKTTVQSCRGASWQFIVNGTSNLVPAPIYYVRGMNAIGGFGPATFFYTP